MWTICGFYGIVSHRKEVQIWETAYLRKCGTHRQFFPFMLTFLNLPWVNGSDPEWLCQKQKVDSEFADDRPQRYRDWGLLRYWFRGVEAYTPWVNRIHFITWGHLPPLAEYTVSQEVQG